MIVLLSAGTLLPLPGVTALNRDRLNKRILNLRLSGASKIYNLAQPTAYSLWPFFS